MEGEGGGRSIQSPCPSPTPLPQAITPLNPHPTPTTTAEKQTKAARDAHVRAVQLAKKQAKVYARERKRERKASGLATCASPAASPTPSRRTTTGSVDGYLEFCDSAPASRRTSAAAPQPASGLGARRSSDGAASRDDGRRAVPASPLAPSPLRGLATADRAWSSLRSLPDALPATPTPLASAEEELGRLSASQCDLALPPVVPEAALDTVELSSSAQQLLEANGTRFPDPPRLHFYPLWECPFEPGTSFGKRRSAAVAQMMATYRRLQSATQNMVHKVDNLLLKEYSAGESALRKRQAKELKVRGGGGWGK